MKNLLLISLLSLLSLAASSQQYGWTDISANIPDTISYDLWGLSDVYFVSDNEGWISVSSAGIILHTIDGGQTFSTQVTSLETSTEAIYMINENEGYVGGSSGFVYRTMDGGENWNFHGTLPSILTDIDFATTTQGYACADNGEVFGITPNGVTDLVSGLNAEYDGVSAPSVDNMWVCGGDNIVYYDGTSFDFQSGPVGTYNDIFLISDLEGWVVGNNGLIGHTNNGGDVWIQQTNPNNNSLYKVFFLNETIGWAVGIQGTILYTSNGGENWELKEEGLTTNFLRGVYFTSPTNGYIVGNGKTLLKYTQVSGIGELAQHLEFEIYPNPCREKLTLLNLKLETRDLRLEIVDISGRVVYDEEMGRGGEGESSVDVSHLPPGLYLVKLQTEDGVGVQKFIKK